MKKIIFISLAINFLTVSMHAMENKEKQLLAIPQSSKVSFRTIPATLEIEEIFKTEHGTTTRRKVIQRNKVIQTVCTTDHLTPEQKKATQQIFKKLKNNHKNEPLPSVTTKKQGASVSRTTNKLTPEQIKATQEIFKKSAKKQQPIHNSETIDDRPSVMAGWYVRDDSWSGYSH